MKSKLILSDVDGVLLSWVDSFQKWITETQDLTLDPNWESMYQVHEWYGLEMMGGHNLVQDFNNSPAIRHMSPYDDAQKYVKLLHEEGYEFIAITAMGSNDEGTGRRWKNLRSLFGEAIIKLDVTPLHNDKHDWLNKYEKAIWLEDKPSNAETGFNLGHETYLITHDHNKDHELSDGITRVKGWKELYKRISNENQ